MLSSVYLFGELGNGYTQYLDDHTESVFKNFASRTKAGTRLLVHRDGWLVYYAYIRRLDSQKYIGMCYVVSGKLIVDYEKLFSIFEDAISVMAVRGRILEFSQDGTITSSLDKLYQCKSEFAQVSEYLRTQFECIDSEKIMELPPRDFSINTQESKTYTVKECPSEIYKALKIYPYIYIVKNEDYDSDNVKSYASILSRNKKRIKDLENGKRKLQVEVSKLKRQQRNTTWVSVLLIVAVVFGVVIWNRVLFPSEVTKKDMGEYVYYGPIQDGKPNGVGVAIYHENDKDQRRFYYGNFTHGRRVDDKAMLFYNDGSYFYGKMNDDQWIWGLFYDTEQEHFEGEFKNNEPYNGEWYQHKRVQEVSNGNVISR